MGSGGYQPLPLEATAALKHDLTGSLWRAQGGARGGGRCRARRKSRAHGLG